MNTNPTIAELAAEVTDLVDRCGATEFQLQELIDADLACRLDGHESSIDDLDYRLTEVESLVDGLEVTDINTYLDTLFDKQRESEQLINDLLTKVSDLEHRLACVQKVVIDRLVRLEGQSFLARLFRKGVK